MFKKLLLAAILAVSVFSCAQAQDDSLYYDLGRVLVRKTNTKTTTIKGVDLEKYQASNLSDAINVWLYGTYSTSSSIVYVIDGNILTDVNVYSIFDIEEVTLVESATAQSSGAGPGRQMVLIKLRTDKPGGHGIEVNGQNSLIDLRNSANGTLAQANSTNPSAVYDEYYLSGFKNYKNVHIGISAEYERDVNPGQNGYGLEFLEPATFNRFKLNTYLTAKLWKGTTLTFGASYLPQANRYSFEHDTLDTYIPDTQRIYHNTRVTQHLLNSTVSIKSDIATGLTNRFSIGYSHSNYFETDMFNNTFTQSANDSLVSLKTHAHNFLLRDYLIYHGRVGEFDVEPTLNFTYRNTLDSADYTVVQTNKYNGFPDDVYHYHYFARRTLSRLFVTPSVDINLKEIVDMQGGIVVLPSAIKDTSATAHPAHIYPFVSASLNLAKLLGITAIRWQLFTSYSKQGSVLADESTTLYNFNYAINPYSVAFVAGDPALSHHNDSYQAGMGVGIFKNFSVSYNYEYKYFTSYLDLTTQTDFGPQTLVLPVNSRLVTTHVSARYSVRTSKFSWITTLTGTESHMQALDTAVGNRYNATYLSQGHRWSGGMTHRFTYKNYFGGVDLLYQVGERPENLVYAIDGTPGGLPPLNNNSFTVQNTFFGVRFKVRYLAFMELYVNARNLAQNQSSTITDNRRFYGLGFKAGI